LSYISKHKCTLSHRLNSVIFLDTKQFTLLRILRFTRATALIMAQYETLNTAGHRTEINQNISKTIIFMNSYFQLLVGGYCFLIPGFHISFYNALNLLYLIILRTECSNLCSLSNLDRTLVDHIFYLPNASTDICKKNIKNEHNLENKLCKNLKYMKLTQMKGKKTIS